MAYRNFLKDHRGDQLKAIKQDAWMRIARLFQLPVEADALYAWLILIGVATLWRAICQSSAIDQMKVWLH